VQRPATVPDTVSVAFSTTGSFSIRTDLTTKVTTLFWYPDLTNMSLELKIYYFTQDIRFI